MSGLHLMQAPVDMANLSRYAAERGHSDPDRTAHCLLAESFGRDMMPQPFVIKTKTLDGFTKGTLLAYTPFADDKLQSAASANQKLAHSTVLNPDSIKTVAMSDTWETGTPVLFEVRVWPTKRASRRDAKEPKSEVDFFLGAPENSNRAEVYCQWLADLMRRQGGLAALPDSMVMRQFTMRHVRRRPTSGWALGPDVTITGTAIVNDAECMQLAVRNGIGRHKSYGYGMLLVRPA